MTDMSAEQYDPNLDDDLNDMGVEEAPDLPPVSNEDNTTVVEDEAPKEPVFEDDLHRLMFESLDAEIRKINSLIGTSNAANGDKLQLRNQLTEESTDPEIVAARNARDEAEMKLYELVSPLVDKIVNDVAENQKALEEEIKELDQKVTPGINFFKKTYGEASAEFLTKKERLRGARNLSSATGGRRVRGYNVVVTVGEDVNEYDAMSKAAKALDVDTSTLQDLFFEAAKTTTLKDAPDRVKFVAEIKDTDENGEQTTVVADILAYRPASETDDE